MDTNIKYYKRIFIQPDTLASYKDTGQGLVFVPKETIDKNLKSIIGCPVTLEHGGEKVGTVVDVYFSPEEAGYIAGFNVWNEEAKNNLDNNEYSVSCSYETISSEDRGIHHNINYDEKITDLIFTELAVVKNPRFEEARKKINSINNNQEKEKMIFGKKKNNSLEDLKNLSAFDLIKMVIDEANYHKDNPVNEESEKEKKEEVEIENFNNETEPVDKRKDIRDIAGFLKSKGLSDEDIRYVIGEDEKIAYEPSTESEKDNTCSKDNENKQEKTGEEKIEEKVKENSIKARPILNSIINSISKQNDSNKFITRRERIAETNKKYSLK